MQQLEKVNVECEFHGSPFWYENKAFDVGKIFDITNKFMRERDDAPAGWESWRKGGSNTFCGAFVLVREPLTSAELIIVRTQLPAIPRFAIDSTAR